MAKNSIFRKISNDLNFAYTYLIGLGTTFTTRRRYKKLLQLHPVSESLDLSEYINLWKKIDKNPDKSSYKLFSQYIGENPFIAPEDIVIKIIQPLLNPIEYRPYYQDKNTFDKIIGYNNLPKTLLRSIDGSLLDAEYKPIYDLKEVITKISQTEDRIFIKPSVDSSSGEGVIGFYKGKDKQIYSLENDQKFDSNFLYDYKRKIPNFIIQRALTQHQDVARFNPTSINTIRIATYRSVNDNKPHFLRAIIRIGKSGAYVDNAHAGGLFVGVDENGKLGHYACDQYGNRYEEFNGINFRENTYSIPAFDNIIKFAENVSSKILHARLIALDICLEEDGTPKLVEFNIRGFSTWLFQFTSGTAFGDYTKEIIDYCACRKRDISKVFVEAF